MARKGLLKSFRAPNQDLARLYDNVRDAVDVLASDHDVISSPAANLLVSGPIPAGASAVNFTGGASQTLTLPPANTLGNNVAAVVFFLNTSPNTVTLIPSRGDSVNGSTSLSVATNVLAVLVSDGVSKWLRNV